MVDKFALQNIEKFPQEELFNIDELIKEVKEDLEENNMLIDGEFFGEKLQGIFEENIWVMRITLHETNCYFNFSLLEKLKFKVVTDYEIKLIKCWVVQTLVDLMFESEDEIEFRSVAAMRYKYNVLVRFIDSSNNFNLNFFNNKKGSHIKKFFEKANQDHTVYYEINSILDYIEYAYNKVSDERSEVFSKYLIELNKVLSGLNVQIYSKELPRTRDILLFDNYLNMFFEDINIKEELKKYYKPIQLWWKVTTIIPIRPSEFTRKLKRNALEVENGSYYLRINRVKKRINLEYKTLPVLNKIKITKEIYDLINNYIISTDKYGYSETLLSYEALYKIRLEIAEMYPDLYNKCWAEWGVNSKINRGVFSAKMLGSMISKFYNDIIYGFYNEKTIEKEITPMDTRHIAFTSMMLQGYSPIEIAVIGGHRSLRAFQNYTCSVNTYIDSQVISIIRKNINISTKENTKIMNKIFGMSKECPKALIDCIEADIDNESFGFCTANYKENTNPCEDEECYYCSKWWCEPTEFNFLRLEKIVRKKLLIKDNKLKRDLEFMMSLLKEIGFEVIDGKLVIDKTISQGLKRISLELDSNTKNVMNLKYQLVENSDSTYKLLSDLEDLLPTKEVTKIISESKMSITKEWEDKLIWHDQENK